MKGSTRKIGSVRYERGHKRIKISNTGDHVKDWAYESHIVFKEHYGDIPPDCHIIHLDGNVQNNSIDNLALIDKKTQMILCQNEWLSKGEVTKAGIKYSELLFALKELAR